MPNSHDSHARNTFRLLTLGGLTLVDPSGVIVGQQRRRLALLALVASAGERGVSRDRLVACLSPESPTEAARHSLEQLVYYLRKRVGVELFLGTDPLRLNPGVISSDLADFERALQEGHPDRAAGLYRGPFLEGFHLGIPPSSKIGQRPNEPGSAHATSRRFRKWGAKRRRAATMSWRSRHGDKWRRSIR